MQKYALASKVFMLGSWRNASIEQCARVSLLSCLDTSCTYLGSKPGYLRSEHLYFSTQPSDFYAFWEKDMTVREDPRARHRFFSCLEDWGQNYIDILSVLI